MLDSHLKLQAESVVKSCMQQASLFFAQPFNIPKLSFKLKGKCAGKAYLQLWEIRLNPVLFAENIEQFLDEVIAHEIAHLLVYKLYGPKAKPHGKEWQSIMWQVFHVQPKTTHSFNLDSVRGQGFEYRCSCQVHCLTIRRHNKVLKGLANYRCTRCQQELQFTGHIQASGSI